MPRSIFLGRPWPQPGEPLWLDEDTQAALAFIDFVRRDAEERCARCDTKQSDWFDEDGRYLRVPKWGARIIDCEGCRVLDEAHEELAALPPEDRSGKRVALGRFDPDAEEPDTQVHPDDGE